MTTGPHTAEGKANSSKNSYKHGVYSRQIRLRPEEQPDFDIFRRGLLIDLKPDGALQNEIFTRLLRTLWTLRRLDRQEDEDYCATGRLDFDKTIRYRRFLAKEQRDLTAELQRLQTEAAVRHVNDGYEGIARLSILVQARPLVDLHNARGASPNQGRPRIAFSVATPAVDAPSDPPRAA